MKLDLILENIRNQYTLGLLEESVTVGADEKEVLKGKLLINESTMEIRKMLIDGGLMEEARLYLENTFADIIEEFTWDDAEDVALRTGKAIVNVPVGAVDGAAAAAGAAAKDISNGNYGRAALDVAGIPGAAVITAGMGAKEGFEKNSLIDMGPAEAAKFGYNSNIAPVVAAVGGTSLGLGAVGGAGYLLGRRSLRR